MKEKMYLEEAMYRLSTEADRTIYYAVQKTANIAKDKLKFMTGYEKEYERLSGLLKILTRGHLYIKPYFTDEKYFKRGKKYGKENEN